MTWSTSGRFAIIDGNVIDFAEGSSVCLGYYPRWTAITDQAIGYGTLDNGDPARIDLAAGSEVTALAPGTMLPLGIGEGGYGIFATEAAVLPQPASR